MSVVDDQTRGVTAGDADPWAVAMAELLANEAALPPEPLNVRRRAVIAVVLILGLIAAGILVILAGAALGASPTGGCGGG